MVNKNQEMTPEETSPEQPIEEQVKDQTGQRNIQVAIDERNLKTSYSNGFMTGVTAEEVVIDFGFNRVQVTNPKKGEGKIVFHANERIIMNYYSAKRLAIALGQIVRRYEQKFGEIELNAAKRETRR
jgi:hypothetical protein